MRQGRALNNHTISYTTLGKLKRFPVTAKTQSWSTCPGGFIYHHICSGRTCLYFGARMADAPTYHVSPSPVHDLVHNHLFPGTTAQIDATQETLKHLQNAVHDVDADLVQMRTAFQHLLAKRAALQDYTDAHQRLVAPVHRLPTEILVGIFLHTLAAPWNLSAGGGRTLRPRPPSCGATSVWIFTNAIQTVIYLSRGKHPLTISLGQDHTADIESQHPALDLLVAHCERWHTMHLQLPLYVLGQLTKAKGTFSLLRSLHLPTTFAGAHAKEIWPILQDCPNLVEFEAQSSPILHSLELPVLKEACFKLTGTTTNDTIPVDREVPWNVRSGFDAMVSHSGCTIATLRLQDDTDSFGPRDLTGCLNACEHISGFVPRSYRGSVKLVSCRPAYRPGDSELVQYNSVRYISNSMKARVQVHILDILRILKSDDIVDMQFVQDLMNIKFQVLYLTLAGHRSGLRTQLREKKKSRIVAGAVNLRLSRPSKNAMEEPRRTDMAARNKRSLSGTSASDIGELRRKVPRLEVDSSRLCDSNETSSSTRSPNPSGSSFNTAHTSGHAVINNVAGDYIVNTDKEKEKEMKMEREKAFAKEVCLWLAAADPSRNYHAARETNHAQTGSWFICGKAFARWKAVPDRPLWLYGSPGCGKTIISSSAVEYMIRHCKEQPSSACAYFFFDSRNAESELSLHENFVRSIVLQLWHKLDRMPAALEDSYGEGPSHTQPSLLTLQATLQGMIGEFQHVYIVIDALDECADRDKLLRWVKDISRCPGGKLHIMLSSRRERDIEDNLVDIKGLERVSFAGGSANPDIVKFVDERLTELIIWIHLDPEIRILVRDALLEGADGSFRWVALQLKELSRCPNVRALKQKLRELPKDLEETYQQLLSSCSSSQANDLWRFLNWVAFSARPITLEELAEVVTIDFPLGSRPCYDRDLRYVVPRDVLTVCSGFITEFEASQTLLTRYPGIVKLSHMSVKDYLLSDQISSGAAAYYSITASQAHCLIAQTSLAYLVHPGILHSLDNASVATLPLAHYAAEHWTAHFRGCNDIPPPVSLRKLLSHLFVSAPNAYANWMVLVGNIGSRGDLWTGKDNLISAETNFSCTALPSAQEGSGITKPSTGPLVKATMRLSSYL
ncbi:hypothetical protein FIBSPDRAFT_896191 [Athelia psychrophila]|uniref:Nephrocystin 3-like N-terminal domain-containing protein n=1 Tax=Athelia psychrophila TaxID=1759441 RepID=A0A166DQU8_9AGAM|nr:hypothetical protein FIBSPDRAFT_896191 [Fibularhizoctonia sp. CBS 109695]